MAPFNPRKRILSFLLSSTFLTGSLFFGCTQTGKGQDRGRDARCLTPKEELALDALKHNPLMQNKPDTIIYYGRDSTKLAFFRQNYALTGDREDQVPDTALTLWQNMQTLRNSKTIIGPALANASIKAHIFYGYEAMPGGVAGLWSGYYGTATISNSNSYSKNFRLSCQVHETIHGIQNANGAFRKDMSWSIWDFQRSCLATEASAMAGEYLVALEFYDDSIPGLLNEKDNIDARTKNRLVKAWKAAVADSLPYAQDLAAIGKNEFYMQMKQQWWLDFYNNSTLETYIRYMNYGLLKAPSGNGYSLAMAQKTGSISPDFNFTAGLDSMPASLFGTNARMKKAFAYAECTRLCRTLGDKDSLYLAAMARLKKEKNPYLGVDMYEVANKLADPANKLDALEVMDYFAAELKKATQPVPAVIDTLKNKLKKRGP